MKRRKFIYGISMSIPAIGLTGACKNEPMQESGGNEIIERVKTAMLSMQRAPWEQGVAMQGIIENEDDNLLILMAKDAVLRQSEEGRLAMLGGESVVTDPGSNGIGVLHAWKLSGDNLFKTAADKQYNYYKKTAPTAPNGSFFHFDNSRMVWSDSMFMAPPFLAFYGDYDEALKQVDGYREYLWNPEFKMYYHQWDDEIKDFRRKEFWGGGNGWCAAGMAQILDALPENYSSEKVKLTGYIEDLLDGCLKYLRTDGLFHDVINNPVSFIETNLGQMLAYTILKGINSGWLNNSYLKYAFKMRDAALQKIDNFGFIQGACGSPKFDRPGTSTEAQAFFLMMEGEYLKHTVNSN